MVWPSDTIILPWYFHSVFCYRIIPAWGILSLRSSYHLCSQPDDRLHTSSRLNHKRWKSIETQDDLKCELIMNSTLYAGAGGNHVWGIESWIYFSLKDIKHKAEVVNPLPHWRRVESAHQKSFRGAGGHVFCVQPRSLGSASMYLCVILIDITLY